MAFFASAITTLQTLVIALGAGLGVWGVVNLLEGYGSDNPGSNAQVWGNITVNPHATGCSPVSVRVGGYVGRTHTATV